MYPRFCYVLLFLFLNSVCSCVCNFHRTHEEWCSSYLFPNHDALYQQVNSVIIYKYIKTLIMKA